MKKKNGELTANSIRKTTFMTGKEETEENLYIFIFEMLFEPLSIFRLSVSPCPLWGLSATI